MSERERISLSCSAWFWFCLFLLAAQPCLNAGEERGAADSLFQCMSNACNGGGDVGLRHLRRGHTGGTDNRVSIFPECPVNTFIMFDVFPPLFESKGCAGFANNPSFFAFSGRSGLQEVNERSQQSPDDYSSGSNQGDKDSVSHGLDREGLLLGMLLGVGVAFVSLLGGAFLMGLIRAIFF